MSTAIKRYSLVSLIKDLVFLVRAGNLLIVALVQYLTSYFLIAIPKPYFFNLPLHYIILATLCTAAAGYIINDYYDIKIDSVNKPERVVIDRKIHRRNALIWHGFLDVSALVFAFLVSYKMVFLVGSSIFLLWVYSNHFKRLPFYGNLIIALLSAITILLIPYHYRQLNTSIFVYATFSFLLTLVREIVKDMEDMEGDQRFHCKTLPIVLGIKRTKYIIYFLVILLLSLIIYFLISSPSIFLLYLVIIGLFYFMWTLSKADTRKEFDRLSSLCKWLMLVGILSVVM